MAHILADCDWRSNHAPLSGGACLKQPRLLPHLRSKVERIDSLCDPQLRGDPVIMDHINQNLIDLLGMPGKGNKNLERAQKAIIFIVNNDYVRIARVTLVKNPFTGTDDLVVGTDLIGLTITTRHMVAIDGRNLLAERAGRVP